MFKSEYAVLNAAALTVFGFTSSVLGGILCDKLQKKSHMAKSQVIMFGNFASLPLILAAVLTSNFWVAMSCFALKVLVSGSYYAPAVTMMQNSTDSSNSGFVVSAYTFYAHIAQSISPFIFGLMARKFNAAAFPQIYGYIVLAAVCVGYLGSSIFYYRAGKAYSKMMTEKEEQKRMEAV
mmetsp:Transcript_10536/g.17677  ORF Transcript_10536/g.17677 Transcript_10536/m.17677 type:complete len:179 (+) Transcript_10536:1069-1605(+)